MTGQREPGGSADDGIDAALVEFAAALSEGQSPEPAEFCRARPACGPELRERIEDLLFAAEGLAEARARRTGDAAALAPAAGLGEGVQLGDYRVIREIGRGGMGVVYLAEQVSLRRLVALKVLPAHLTLQAQAIERFQREASTAARLRHPGIVEIHAVGQAEGTHFFAMEFVKGSPLDRVVAGLRATPLAAVGGEQVGALVTQAIRRIERELLDAHRPAAPPTPPSTWSRSYIETACLLIARVADALDHAHRANVVHRDVKPSNILVREDGSPVITDFGLAREDGLPSVTLTGQFAGTPSYVSPEQAKGGAVDARTDIFSLGITLYELLTLQRPFDAPTTQGVLAQIVGKEAPNPRTYNPALPRDLVTILQKSIEKNPERRYATAAAFAADLRALVSFQPIAARPASTGTRVLKFVQRHRAASAVAGATVLAAVAAAGWWWSQPGYLEVTSPTAGAQVFVDGELRGTTPCAALALDPGLHRVRLVKDDEDLEMPRDDEVLVWRGSTRQYDRAIPSRNGVVRLESAPAGARVTLHLDHGEPVPVPQATPTIATVRAGSYRARFELAGFAPREERVEVGAAGMSTLCATQWETGTLLIQGKPGTQVDVHAGERAGAGEPLRKVVLPLEAPLELPAGTYSLRARLREHERLDVGGPRAFHVESGSATQAGVWLVPLHRRFEVAANDGVASLVPADLDGDGVAEILAATVSTRILALNGDGSLRFEARADGYGPNVIAVDLDADRALEIVCALGGGATERGLLVWNADGSRRAGFEQTRTTGSADYLAAADLTGDQRPELIVNTGTGVGAIQIFGADGARLPPPPVGERVSTLLAIDLAGDARKELVARSESGAVVAFAGDGTVLWRTAIADLALPLSALDADGDGRPEVLAPRADGTLTLLGADGSAREAWPRPRELPATRWQSPILAADLDGDGRPELIAPTGRGRIVALAADGSVHFEAAVGAEILSLFALDLDGQGQPALAVGTNEGTILVLDAAGALRFELETRGAVERVTGADVDGDGRSEIIAATSMGQVLAIGTPRTSPGWESAAAENISAHLVDDVDGDGHLEVVVGTEGGGILGFSAEGAPVFETRIDGRVQALAVIDGPSGGPAIVAASSSGWLAAYTSTGSKSWEAQLRGRVAALASARWHSGTGVVATTSRGQAVAVSAAGRVLFEFSHDKPLWSVLAVDLDDDGDDEIIAGDAMADHAEDFRGDVLAISSSGSRLWTAAVGGAVSDFAAADLDGDGTPEIAGGICVGYYRLFALNAAGRQVFKVSARAGWTSVVALDLDRDGRDELIGGTLGGHVIGWRADGSRVFETKVRGRISALASSDLDRDGSPELLATSADGEILVLDASGSSLSRLPWRSAIYGLAVGDLDGDGSPEVSVAGGRLLAVYPTPSPDPRAGQRRAFLAALDAAERGDERAAERGFAEARLGWLAFDDTDLSSIRGRLAAASSAAARSMGELFERVRPATPTEWVDALKQLAAEGRTELALGLARRHLAKAPPAEYAWPLNELAWSFVAPGSRVRGAEQLALVLARAAVEASARAVPQILDTLAEALHANGQSAEAAAVEEEALEKCAPDDPDRATLAKSLERFRAALSPAGK